MSPQLPSSLTSLEDLKGVIAELSVYANWFAASSIKRRVLAKSSVANPPSLSAESIALIQELSNQQQLTTKSLEALIDSLQSIAEKSPQLTITLAAPASSNLKKDLVAWCRSHVAPSVLVSFRFNATLLGGMVIQYGSHVYDWSFRRQILANRDRFPEVLRRV